jgi:hypothetical protein
MQDNGRKQTSDVSIDCGARETPRRVRQGAPEAAPTSDATGWRREAGNSGGHPVCGLPACTTSWPVMSSAAPCPASCNVAEIRLATQREQAHTGNITGIVRSQAPVAERPEGSRLQ